MSLVGCLWSTNILFFFVGLDFFLWVFSISHASTFTFRIFSLKYNESPTFEGATSSISWWNSSQLQEHNAILNLTRCWKQMRCTACSVQLAFARLLADSKASLAVSLPDWNVPLYTCLCIHLWKQDETSWSIYHVYTYIQTYKPVYIYMYILYVYRTKLIKTRYHQSSIESVVGCPPYWPYLRMSLHYLPNFVRNSYDCVYAYGMI